MRRPPRGAKHGQVRAASPRQQRIADACDVLWSGMIFGDYSNSLDQALTEGASRCLRQH